MAALLGKIKQFNPDQEDWPQYVERLQQFFEANDLTGEDKAVKCRATFLTVIGPAPYRLLRSLLSPETPSSNTFEELAAKLTEHYHPEPPEVMQRFRFNSRSRNPGESVAAYIADLRRIAQYCNFGITLDKMFRDRLVWGVNDDHIRRKLLQEKDKDLALSAETADRSLREMRAPQKELSTSHTGVPVSVKTEPVHNVRPRRRFTPRAKEGERTCHRCGAPGHLAPACRFKDRICHHAARSVRQVGEESDTDVEDSLQPILTVQQRSDRTPPIQVHVEIDKCTVPMEVDTGASVSLMGEALYYKLWPRRGLGSLLLR